MDKETVVHTGKVVSATGKDYTILFDKAVKCEGCAASLLCRDSNNQISVDKLCSKEPLKIGECVKVEISTTQEWRAITFSILMPLAVLIVLIAVVMLIWHNETAACISAFAGVLAYFAIIHKIRLFSRGKYKYNFKIYRLTN